MRNTGFFAGRSILPVLAAAASLLAAPAFAHITPNVQLVKKSAFVQQVLPGATNLFAKDLTADVARRVREATGWSPNSDELQLYVGRDAGGALVGSVVFLWTASEHGPLGVGVAFDPAGAIRAATVTDVASEPLTWVRPLLEDGRIAAFDGLAPGATADPAAIAPAVQASMPRYYAKVIAESVARARAVERAALQPASGAGRFKEVPPTEPHRRGPDGLIAETASG